LATTGLPSLDNLLGADGYPDKSTVLVVGAPGVGKEALAYWFTHAGLVQNDFSMYATRLSAKEVLQDTKAFGVDFSQKIPFWLSREGGQIKLDPNDLSGISISIKDVLRRNSDRRIRVVTDVVSSLLMLNTPETIYKFLSQLFEEVKKYDAVFLATLEEGMHPPNVVAAMEQLFDGVIELKLYEEGLRVLPLLRVRKMRGVPPQPGYYNFAFSKNGLEISVYGR